MAAAAPQGQGYNPNLDTSSMPVHCHRQKKTQDNGDMEVAYRCVRLDRTRNKWILSILIVDE
jgi:hypothetical protein